MPDISASGSARRPWIADSRPLAPAGPTLKCEAGIATEQGPRARNEDFVAAVRHGGCFIAAIADGMGGARGGREAAEICVRGVIEALIEQPRSIGWRRALVQSIEPINSWIYAMGRRDPLLARMGCTLSAMVVQGRQIHLAHAGDTRIYRLRDGDLVQLTEDHTPGTPETRHLLTRGIGLTDTIRIDYAADDIRLHDRYLLCSDGVHNGVPGAQITEILNQRAAPEQTARDVVAAALAAHSGDNATALVLDVLALPPPDALVAEDTLAALPVVPPPRLGGTLDGYLLHTLLVDGRYARVFRATDQRDHGEVILKFPNPGAGDDATLRRVLLREAMVAGSLHSPFVGEVRPPNRDRQTALYLVMPFYPGETLERRITGQHPVGINEGLDIAAKLAKAVVALHRKGIVHRDIKPENVILQPDGGLKLIDLGVAKLPLIEDAVMAENPGTASYMAPELIVGATDSVQSDLYALGVTIYRLFTRAFPYGEIEPFSHPRFIRPTPLSVARPDLPSWLDQAVMRAVAKHGRERYADGLEFLFDLEHGGLRAAPARKRRLSFYDRDPVRFWQLATAALAVLVVVLVVARL